MAKLPSLCSEIDELILFRRNHWNKPSGWFDFLRFLRSLRHRTWDVVIDAQGLFRSGLCAWFAGDGNNVYGFSDAREGATFFYDHKIHVPDEKVHAVDKNLHLLGSVLGEEVTYVAPTFKPDEDGRSEVDDLLGSAKGDRPLVAVAVGSRWPSKNWPPDFFAKTIDRLLEHGAADLALIGSPGEVAIGEEVDSRTTRNGCVNLIGKTSLAGMVEVIRRSAAVLTNDSGPMHVAAAMSIPTVTFFGPTSPEKTGPYGSIHKVFKSALECSPCFSRTCPLPKQQCLEDTVTPESAANAVISVLEEVSND